MRKLLLFLVACGGSPANNVEKPLAPNVVEAVADDRSVEITSNHARKLAAAAVEWRRSHSACPSTKNLTDDYAFGPGTELDGKGAPLSIECGDAEIRVLAAQGVVHTEPFSMKAPDAPAPNNVDPPPPQSSPISLVVRQKFRTCYGKALNRDPNLSGELHGTIVIAPDKKIKDVIIDKQRTTLTDKELLSCLVKSIKDVPYDGETSGKETRISF